MLPFLLFACREAPCSTTGFSPFELIFGKKVLLQEWMPTAFCHGLAAPVEAGPGGYANGGHRKAGGDPAQNKTLV